MESVPFLDGALEAVRLGAIPGGLIANREFAECVVFESSNSRISVEKKMLLFDPQTSGGLLIAVSREQASALSLALVAQGCLPVQIGRVLNQEEASATMGLIQLR